MADIVAFPQLRFDERQTEIMRRTIGKDVPPEEFAFFLEVAMARGLNPFNREIYPIMRKGKLTIQTGIDGFRKLADGSGLYRGQEGPFFCDKDRNWHEVWLEDEPPMAAKVGIWREGFHHPTWAIARYLSYVQYDREGHVTDTWRKMPDIMLPKCAEALSLRKTFPAQLAGLYIPEEMMQADSPIAGVVRAPTTKILYTRGEEAGLWNDRERFYGFVSDVLDRSITPENAQLSVRERARIEQVIDEEIANLHPATQQDAGTVDGSVSVNEVPQEMAEQSA